MTDTPGLAVRVASQAQIANRKSFRLHVPRKKDSQCVRELLPCESSSIVTKLVRWVGARANCDSKA